MSGSRDAYHSGHQRDAAVRRSAVESAPFFQLEDLARASQVLVWSATELGRFEWVCCCWNATTGQLAASAVGEGWLDVIHPEDRALVLDRWREADACGAPVEVEVRVAKGAGGYSCRLLRASRVAEFHAASSRWLGVLLEVDRLVESRDQAASIHQAILETALDGIVTITDKGDIESFNRAASQVFGYEAVEVIGRNVSLLMPEPYASKHDSFISRYIETGERQIIGTGREVVGRRKDGSTFPLSLAVSEVRWGDRRLFAGVLRDMTDLRKAQAAAFESERLAGIGQMVAAIGHESRNALQRIQASTEMLRVQIGERDESCLQDLETIEQADRELCSLFSELGEWAKPPKLVIESHRLESLCQRAWEDVISVADERDAEMKIHASGLDPDIEVDGEKIKQVLRNLFQNSLDSLDGPVKIDVRVSESSLDSRPALALLARDNGSGISTQEPDQVFEAFCTTKRRGVGLGLAIAKRLVEAHGGTIRATEPQPALGAEFEMVLPREHRSPQESIAAVSTASGERGHEP